MYLLIFHLFVWNTVTLFQYAFTPFSKFIVLPYSRSRNSLLSHSTSYFLTKHEFIVANEKNPFYLIYYCNKLESN